MRRAGRLWEQVVSFDALCRAAHRAARGKRGTAAAAAFLERLEPQALELERALRAGTWRPGPAARFDIRDPKLRTITALPFGDRVVHHALIAPLEPVFERRMIADSFACRRGKGTHRALCRARRLLRRHRWSLRMDVQKFFDSLHHDVVQQTLARVVKDRRVLALCAAVLAGPEPLGSTGVGLPIGSLTSQWWANLVLDRLDHFVKEALRVPGYVRYMDDLALFADDKATLRAAHEAMCAFLDDPLRLSPKARATRLAPASEGMPFLGWRVFRGTVRIAPANLRRYRWRLRLRRWQWETGRIDGEGYRRAVAAVVAHLAHGDTRGLRRTWCGREGTEL